MTEKKPSYRELETKLAEAEQIIQALAQGQTDAVLSQGSIQVLRVREVEEALRQSEERYRTLFNSIDEGFCIIEVLFNPEDEPVDYRFLDVNPAFVKQTELPNVVGQRIRALVPHQEEYWFQIYGRVAVTGRPERFTQEARYIAGGRIYNVYAFRLGRPEERKVAVIFSDVTEQRQTENALRESEERFRVLVQAVAQAVWETEPDGTVVTDSPSWRASTGQTREELLTNGWLNAVHPDDRAFVGRYWSEVTAGGGFLDVEFRLKSHDGTWRWTKANAAPIRDSDGSIIKWVGMNIDITPRKEAVAALAAERELLEIIFDSIPVMLTIYEPNLNMTRLNRAVYVITGWTEEDVRQHGILNLIYPDPQYRQEVTRYMESLQPGFKDVFMVCKNGTIKETTWANVQITDGRRVGIGIDITQRKQAEEALRRLNENLEQRVVKRTVTIEQQSDRLRALTIQLSQTEQRERKRLARVLHDYIQQHIVAAKMRVEMLGQDDEPAQRQMLTQEVDEILYEALEATRSLTADLHLPLLDMDGLVGGLNWLAASFQKKNLFTVKVWVEGNAEPASEDMRYLLFQSARELLFNAIKHAGVNEAELRLAGDVNGCVKLTVADQGRGFDPDLAHKGGSGDVTFGLFNIQQRLAYVGGSVTIETAPGQGTRITLTTPPNPAVPCADEAEPQNLPGR